MIAQVRTQIFKGIFAVYNNLDDMLYDDSYSGIQSFINHTLRTTIEAHLEFH